MIEAGIVMGSLGVAVWALALSLCAYSALIRSQGRKP